MFAKFKFALDKENNTNDRALFASLMYYQRYGHVLYSKHKDTVKTRLESYLSVNGVLDAEKIEKDWFPNIPVQVFFSHSHLDEQLVVNLAGFLHKCYGIESFIDSTVWGYSNNLLKQIDEKYCRDGVDSYNYDMRNQSTAHVHMLLQGALAKMIDTAECIIFVNTPNSLNVQDIGDADRTSSPWIYNELLMASTFPASDAARYGIPKRANAHDSVKEHVQIPISYPAKLKGM